MYVYIHNICVCVLLSHHGQNISNYGSKVCFSAETVRNYKNIKDHDVM